MKLNGRVVVSERSADSCPTVLNTHVSRKTKEGQGDYTGLKKAFHRNEEGKASVSQDIYNQISSYFRNYHPLSYGTRSPYTSIVGPSGIGKSFALQSIARKGLSYVVYVNLSTPATTAYPPRSYISRRRYHLTSDMPVFNDHDRARMTTQFECFIAASVRQVRLCRRYSIHPIDFFKM
jgi:hypothetical protein